MSKTLLDLLEERAGVEEFRIVVPHPFLPPRFRRISQERNMILLLDRDFTVHVRWEGARLYEYLSLTPKATSRLLKECLQRMIKYRKDLQQFSKFVAENAEQPFNDPREDPLPPKNKELPKATLLDAVFLSEEECIQEALHAERMMGLGGENPMPTWEDFDE